MRNEWRAAAAQAVFAAGLLTAVASVAVLLTHWSPNIVWDVLALLAAVVVVPFFGFVLAQEIRSPGRSGWL